MSNGVIHVQTSFNNTIVAVTNVRGQVVFWPPFGISGFIVKRRETPFVAQPAITNIICTIFG